MNSLSGQYPSITELSVYSEATTIKEIQQISTQINELRPLDKETEDRIMQKLRLEWNYNSNAIEGNSLDYGETVAFLMHGVTSKGKPLKDYLDIRGHNEAIDYLVDLVKNNEDISEKDIRSIHEIILVEPYKSTAISPSGQNVQKTIQLGQYKTMPNHVKTVTGEIHYYATPEETPILMRELIDWYRTTQTYDKVHPVVIAAIFHHRFASIHPFDDGNGRVARLLMNMILMKYYYPPVIIRKENKDEYYAALSQADAGNIEPFINYISEELLRTITIYLSGAKGESIEEPADLDKKLLLFKKEVEANEDRIETKITKEAMERVMHQSVKPIIVSLRDVIKKFKEFFLDSSEYILSFSGASNNRLWEYEKHDLINLFSIDSEEINSVYEKNFIIFCFQLSDFKVKSKTFSLEIKLAISFYELDYRIFYTVSQANQIKGLKSLSYTQWLSSSYFLRYYHQDVQSKDIEKLSSRIGNEVFDYVQKKYENFETNENQGIIKVTESELRAIWTDFMSESYTENSDLYSTFIDLNKILVENSKLIVDIAPDFHLMEIFDKERTDVQEKFYKYLKTKKIIEFGFIVQLT